MVSARVADGLTDGQAAVRRLVGLGAAIVALLVLGAAALLAAGSQALDDLQAREDRAMVRNAVERALNALVSDVTTATVWNQAYEEFRPGGDLEFADEEIGSYFANNRGHDWSVAIDGKGVPFYAWVGPERADPAAQGRFLAAAAPLVRDVRALETRRAEKPPVVAPTDPALAETAHGVVVSDGVHYLVAVSTVVPETAGGARRPGPGVVVVSGQRMDQQLVAALRQMQLAGVRVDPQRTGATTTVPLRDVNGRPVGEIAWTPERPGLEALTEAAPVLILGALPVTVLIGALAWQVRRVVRRLSLHERAHAAALHDLAEARDRAESANIAKSQFLANMSHEIRTPLNGVLGMAQVLERSPLPPAEREKVQVIRASGETLLDLLNDLLDLAKIEAGRMEISVDDFDLEDVVQTATRAFAALAAQKDVEFFVDVAPEARGVWRGDSGRIRQILVNLVSNAVKFTSTGEVRVRVCRTAAGVACTVVDTGDGIAPDRLAQLFQRFHQADPSDTRRYGGTGLGLAISRELAELLGGEVSATSVEGEGSAFTLELPLPWVGPRTEPSAQAADEPMLPPLRILAAEDNKTNQLLLAAVLEPLGAELRIAENGRRAVEAFTSGSFDLVLMDVQMPVMNGVDATRRIRALEAARGARPIPILALSANVMRHQVDEYLAAGMNDVVAKPIEITRLIAAIQASIAHEAPESAVA